MHRPIVASETAAVAEIVSMVDRKEEPLQSPLDRKTYEYVQYSQLIEQPYDFVGRVSSYNLNTFKGRIYFLK